MALDKSKKDIIDKILEKDKYDQLIDVDSYWDYWDYWEFTSDYDEEYIHSYDYLPSNLSDDYLIIDMNSIYSKEIMRQKKINYLLGLEKLNFRPTFLDIMILKK